MFGPGWWGILGRIYTVIGDHNWEVLHGRASVPVRVEEVVSLEGMMIVKVFPENSPVSHQVAELMNVSLDMCEECGRSDPLWWGLEKPEELIAGKCRVLCEPCFRSMKGYADVLERARESIRITPLLEIEPWFPGKDERDDEIDGEEIEDWKR
jgi:hypothetical protein